eukprot:7241065-Karenia_brevis.AAC.1
MRAITAVILGRGRCPRPMWRATFCICRSMFQHLEFPSLRRKPSREHARAMSTRWVARASVIIWTTALKR